MRLAVLGIRKTGVHVRTCSRTPTLTSVTCVTFVRYLDIALDESLKWETHINIIYATLSRNIGVMGRVCSSLSPKEVGSITLHYNTLILPYISYCAVVSGGSYAGRLNKLVKLQKRALKIIDDKPGPSSRRISSDSGSDSDSGLKI